jgi:nitrite reductase/ring-hydroxylating ferredoxin subunit
MEILFETAACRLDEIPDGRARGLVLPDMGDGPLRVLVLRRGDAVIAYRNRCPHRGTPLDLRPDDFLDREGKHIVCATHGAIFRPEDGYCLAGPCAGDSLEPIPARVENGIVLVDPDAIGFAANPEAGPAGRE